MIAAVQAGRDCRTNYLHFSTGEPAESFIQEKHCTFCSTF